MERKTGTKTDKRELTVAIAVPAALTARAKAKKEITNRNPRNNPKKRV
jgi:hypothetical protein